MEERPEGGKMVSVFLIIVGRKTFCTYFTVMGIGGPICHWNVACSTFFKTAPLKIDLGPYFTLSCAFSTFLYVVIKTRNKFDKKVHQKKPQALILTTCLYC